MMVYICKSYRLLWICIVAVYHQKAALPLQTLWAAWNGGGNAGIDAQTGLRQAWNDCLEHQSQLQQHALNWGKLLLLIALYGICWNFPVVIDRMRDSKNLA